MEGNSEPGGQYSVDDYIRFAEGLHDRVASLGSVHGSRKLEKKLRAELKFMNSLKHRDLHTQQSRLKSSNLGHFASLVHASERVPGLLAVLAPYGLPSRPDSLLVDLVAAGGYVWVKVIARKAQALHLVWAGAGQFGERDLLDQAEEYLQCARQHPHQFQTPQVHFAFYNQVTGPMAAALESLGVYVWGERVPVQGGVLTQLEALDIEDSSSSEEDQSPSLSPSVYSGVKVHNRYSLDNAEGSPELPAGTSTTDTPGQPLAGAPLCSDLDHDTTIRVQDLAFSTDTCLSTLGNERSYQQRSSHKSEMKESCNKVDMPDGYVVDRTVSTVVSQNSSAEFSSWDLQQSCTQGQVSDLADSRITISGKTWRLDSTTGDVKELTPPSSPRRPINQSKSDLFLEIVVSPPTFDHLQSPEQPRESTSQTARRVPPHDESHLAHTTPSSLAPPGLTCSGLDRIPRVNLDITSLIALASAVTNGRCHFLFRDKVLTAQAQEERKSPVLPPLQAFLAGKELFACETAVSSFRSILDILGGSEEKARAVTLLDTVTIVPDQPSKRSLALECQGRIKERSKIVFGTGDSLQAVTVTSNSGFVRAAQSQGVVFPVFLHAARALTEKKEPQALPLPDHGV